MILDAGVFIALENPSKQGVVLALVQKMRDQGILPTTNDAALSQAWRNPARQAPMARLVKATTVHSFGDPKVIGLKCGVTGTTDVVDASLAVLSDQIGVPVLTTDPDDMAALGADHREL